MQYIDKVAWIQIQDRKVLGALSQGKTTYYFPGGKREGNESDSACLIREIKEELSVDLLPETIRFMGVFEAPADGRSPEILVRMRCYFADYSGTLHPASEIDSYQWLSYADKLKTSAVVQLIIDDLQRLDLMD